MDADSAFPPSEAWVNREEGAGSPKGGGGYVPERRTDNGGRGLPAQTAAPLFELPLAATLATAVPLAANTTLTGLQEAAAAGTAFAGRPFEPYLSGRRKRNAMARNKLPRRTDGGTEARINNSGPRPAVSRFSSLPARCARRARINRRICLRSCSRHRSPGSSGQRPGRSPAATRSRE